MSSAPPPHTKAASLWPTALLLRVTVINDRLRLTVEARKETVVKLHKQGFSNRKIAAAVGAGEATIRRDLGAPNNAVSAPNDADPGPSECDEPHHHPDVEKGSPAMAEGWRGRSSAGLAPPLTSPTRTNRRHNVRLFDRPRMPRRKKHEAYQRGSAEAWQTASLRYAKPVA